MTAALEARDQLTALRRVLILAHETADDDALLACVADRAARSPCRFTLLVPTTSHGLHRVIDPEDHGRAKAQARLARALPLLSDAAGRPVFGLLGSHDALAAVEDAVNLIGFDEVIVSMLPARISRWLRLDLPHKIRGLGVPVIEVVASEAERGSAA